MCSRFHENKNIPKMIENFSTWAFLDFSVDFNYYNFFFWFQFIINLNFFTSFSQIFLVWPKYSSHTHSHKTITSHVHSLGCITKLFNLSITYIIGSCYTKEEKKQFVNNKIFPRSNKSHLVSIVRDRRMVTFQWIIYPQKFFSLNCNHFINKCIAHHHSHKKCDQIGETYFTIVCKT